MVSNNAVNISAAGLVKYDGTSTFTGVTVTQYSPLVGAASNGITSLGPLTNGQLVIGDTGTNPVAATLTAGTGVSITNGAGSITINASGGGLTWNDVTGTSASAAPNNGYIADNGSLVTITLPATIAQGQLIAVTGGQSGTGGWKIAQGSGQIIYFGNATSTSGATGYIASNLQYDTVFLLCTTANTSFVVIDSIGNITVH